MFPIKKYWLAGAALIILGLGRQAIAMECGHDIDTSAAVLSNGFTLNISSTRNAPSNIRAANVTSLQLAYTHAAYVGSEAAHEKRGASVVTDTTLYTTAGFDVVALDRATGCTHWSYTLPSSNTLVGGDGVRAIYYVNEGNSRKPTLVFAGDNRGHLHAINALTGAKVWSKFMGTDTLNHKITGHPQFHGGKLFVPISSKEVLSAPLDLLNVCCRSHGLLQAVDPYTGNIFWTYHTTPKARFILGWTWRQGPNGAPVWASPTIDPARNAIYIGTGQNYTKPYTNTSDAIIALDMNTGKQKWVFQATADDAFNASCGLPAPLNYSCSDPQHAPDLDFGAAPVLVTRPDGKSAIFAGAKNGVLYSIDPNNGKLMWMTRLGAGSNLGGIHWGLAVDNRKVYVGVSDVIVNKISGLDGIQLDFGAITAANMSLVSDGANPGVYALDMMTGNIVWQQKPTHQYSDPASGEITVVPDIFSAAVTVTNDLVFAGSLNGMMYAFRTSDGAQVWSYNTVHEFTGVNGIAGHGGTIDQVGALPAGSDLLINSGYDHFGGANAFQAGTGNGLFVFRLHGAN